jgi:hypothetical protein
MEGIEIKKGFWSRKMFDKIFSLLVIRLQRQESTGAHSVG